MIASPHNPLVKHLVKLREDRKYRAEKRSVLVTGYKLVHEIAALQTPLRLFVADPQEAISSGEIYRVSLPVLKKITGLPTPEPVAAEFALPQQNSLTDCAPILALDAIRDPGNLGTLLRTALAFGWKGVFFLPTCVDPFNEKTLRASRAALFKLPWRSGTWEDLKAIRHKNNLKAYVADMEGTPFDTVTPSPFTLLVLSNEAQGVATEATSFGEKITIPMKGDMESLNVAIAGSILMYHLNAKGQNL